VIPDGHGIGVVLMQEGRPLSFEKPIKEITYSKPIYEKEMLTILHAKLRNGILT
jgi:hypothetical protein